MIDPTGGASAAGASGVYDGGAERPIVTAIGSPTLNATGATVVAAAAGLRTKLLGFNLYPSAFTSEGTLSIKDGAGGSSIFLVARFTALGQRADFNMSGRMICMGSVNTLIEINYTGNAIIQYAIIYYQAP